MPETQKATTSVELAAQIKELQNRKRMIAEEERKAKGPTRRGRGVLDTAKRILYENPTIKIDVLHKQVEEKVGKCSLSVLQTVRSDFFHTLRVLNEENALRDPKKVEQVVRTA